MLNCILIQDDSVRFISLALLLLNKQFDTDISVDAGNDINELTKTCVLVM
jgi:hypothetical protein